MFRRGASSGIVLGSHSIKVARVRRSSSQIELLGLGAYSRESLQWEGELPEEALERLGKRLGESHLSGSNATLGISGKDLMLRFFSVPPMNLSKLEEVLRFEVGEVAGGQDEVSFGYRLLNLPQKDISEFTVLTAIARNKFLEDVITKLRIARVSVQRICPEGYALYQLFRQMGEPTTDYVLLLDIGGDKCEMVVVWNANLVFARSITPGGAEFTSTIMEALEVDYEDAERIKKARAEVSTGSPEVGDEKEQEMCEALLSVAHRLVGAVQSSIMFCKAQTKLTDMEISKVYLSGGGARIKGMDSFLEQILRIPVEYLDPFSLIKVSGEGAEEIRSLPTPFAVPLGLALVGFDEYPLEVTPPRVRKRMEFWQRKIYSYASVAMFLGAIGVSIALSVHNHRADRLSLENAKSAVQEAKKEEEETQKLIQDYEKTVRRIELLQERAEAGSWFLTVLAKLKALIPEDITLNSVELQRSEKDSVRILLRGVARKERREPLKAFAEFKRKIQGSEIGEPENIEGVITEDGYRFVLLLRNVEKE